MKEKNWKLEEYIKMEKKVQQRWEEEKIYESDAPNEPKEKFMVTFPYPYMNGSLHLGHAFTLTKAEFPARVERLKGKKVLFPFAYHCTGMPIKACADKLSNEIEMFGNPPKFPKENFDKKEETNVKQKSKVASKSVDKVYQWEILESMDVDKNIIHEFSNSDKWLTYFPTVATEDLKSFGSCIDWRRTFITTEKNPYYDEFIKWQFKTLKNKEKILFGKRYTIWSQKDGQACMDHERASGEGVGPQEYTLIKLRVLDNLEKFYFVHETKKDKIYLVAATLRPETMYGQTNCWVLPTGKYGVYEMKNGEVFVCSEWSAHNMAFQGFFDKEGEVNKLGEILGESLIGVALFAPLTSYKTVYTLPMFNISMEKGTGIVTSVPSDSPDDYTTLRDLRNKPQLREKFGIKEEWVLPFEAIPIIFIPNLGEIAAKTVVEELEIKSQNDTEKLEIAKDKVYKAGFYNGKFIVPEYKDIPVQQAKPLIRNYLLKEGFALVYAEPESKVISRSGDVCVVALKDQWYIDYGNEEWKKQVREHLKDVNCYSKEVKNLFHITIDWLNGWACSRSFGLGTRLPWDPQYVIESLSDSTIYMAYYTISHLLQGDIYGSKPGKLGLLPEQLTMEFFDYVFLGSEVQPKNIDLESLKILRKEFEFWYPLDLRVSGKDLVQNHLTFFLYNHLSIFPKKFCPLGIRANGHIQLDDQKMSKSTGNFLTIKEAINRFSADGTRFALAEAGDGINDANFKTDSAIKRVLQLYSELEWIEEFTKNYSPNISKEENWEWIDKVFKEEIEYTIATSIEHLSSTNYRLAVNTSWHYLTKARDEYRKLKGDKMIHSLLFKYCETLALLNSPFVPHFSERVWQLLGKKDLIQNNFFPKVEKYDDVLIKMKTHLFDFISDIRKNQKNNSKSNLRIYVSSEFPTYYKRSTEIISLYYDTNEKSFKKVKGEILQEIYNDELVSNRVKDAQKVIPHILNTLEKSQDLSILRCDFEFDEEKLFLENIHLFKKELKIDHIEILSVQDPKTKEILPSPKNLGSIRPFYPQFIFY